MEKSTISDNLLTATAFLGGAGSIALHVGIIYLSLPFKRLLPKEDGQVRFYRNAPKRISRDVRRCLELFLNTRREIHGVLPDIAADERTIILSNHPSVNGLFYEVDFITHEIVRRIAAASKLENMDGIMGAYIGRPGAMTGNIVPIDRSNTSSAIASLRSGCKTVFQPGTSFLHFADGHRPLPDIIKKSRESCRSSVHQFEDFQYTCVPRYKGVQELLNATADMPRRVLDITAGFNRKDGTWKDITGLRGATFHIDVQEVTDEITDASKESNVLKHWLIERYRSKNQLIGSWKTES